MKVKAEVETMYIDETQQPDPNCEDCEGTGWWPSGLWCLCQIVSMKVETKEETIEII